MEINCITNRASKLFKNTCVKFNDLLSKDNNHKKVLEFIINNSNNQFIIIGPDILITNKDEIKFIEFNTLPNLQHTKYINENVNEKMLFDLFKLVFLNYESDTLLLIK